MMILKKKSTGRIICRDLKPAKTFLDTLFGLLIKSNPRSMLFMTRFGIHTFFLKELIDVVVLNEEFMIVKTKQNLKPNSLFFWNPIYPFIIEFPQGYISRFDLRQAQVLLIC